jgi:hypothetical protein
LHGRIESLVHHSKLLTSKLLLVKAWLGHLNVSSRTLRSLLHELGITSVSTSRMTTSASVVKVSSRVHTSTVLVLTLTHHHLVRSTLHSSGTIWRETSEILHHLVDELVHLHILFPLFLQLFFLLRYPLLN